MASSSIDAVTGLTRKPSSSACSAALRCDSISRPCAVTITISGAGRPGPARGCAGRSASRPARASPVDEHRVVGRARVGARARQRERTLAAVARRRPASRAIAPMAVEHLARGGVVVDDQHAQRARRRRRRRCRRRPRGASGSASSKWKRLPLPASLCDLQLAAHQRRPAAGEMARPEAGAAEAPRRRRLGLREVAEDARLVLGRDADAGVAHGELRRAPPCAGARAADTDDHDLALAR